MIDPQKPKAIWKMLQSKKKKLLQSTVAGHTSWVAWKKPLVKSDPVKIFFFLWMKQKCGIWARFKSLTQVIPSIYLIHKSMFLMSWVLLRIGRNDSHINSKRRKRIYIVMSLDVLICWSRTQRLVFIVFQLILKHIKIHGNNFNPIQNTCLCSKHFQRSDFVVRIGGYRTLSKGAAHSLLAWSDYIVPGPRHNGWECQPRYPSTDLKGL